MHPNPNKFLCFLFSLVPGAGHMYLGLMKRGLSFMSMFIACIFGFIFFIDLWAFQVIAGIFGLALPVVWFAAFFDFWRFPRMSNEEKAAQQDDLLFAGKQFKLPQNSIMRKVRVVIGILLIFAGLQGVYSQLLRRFAYNWFNSYNVIDFVHSIPSIVSAVAIIVVGLLLIFWKAKQIKKEANDDQ